MTSWLATWLLNPLLAFGGLAVASPILIHILSRRRFRRVRWAAMDFLLEAMRRNRRRIRLEQIILLCLRCLVVLLLALMLARPFVRPAAIAAMIGSAPRSDRIILLDDSASMACRRAEDQTVFQTACAAAERIAAWTAAEAPYDSLTVVRATAPDTPGIAVADLSEEKLALLREYLARAEPTADTLDAARAVSAVDDLIRHSAANANSVVYVISDFQRHDWVRDGDADESSGGPLGPLAELVRQERSLRLVWVDVGADRPRNLAITAVRNVVPQAVAAVRTRLEVDVVNYSDRPVDGCELHLALAEQTAAPLTLPVIGPREKSTVPLELVFPHDGSDFLTVEAAGLGDADRLPLDNRRGLALEVLPAVSILVVDGEPSNDPYRDEVFLLRTALSPAGRVASGNEVHVVEEEQLETIELDRYHAIVLANVYRIPPTAEARLEQFVAQGGGLLFFLGHQVDLTYYNARLYRDGSGLLPAELGDPIEAPPGSAGWKIEEWDAAHPVFRPFAGAAETLLRAPRFNSLLSASPAPPPTPPTTRPDPAPQTAPADRPGAARVIAALDDPGRSPLLIERSFGAGRVILCTSSADLEWNGWGRDPGYVAAMLQIAQYLCRTSGLEGQHPVGHPLRIPVDPNRFSPRASLRLPTYPADPPIEIDARIQPDGRFVLEWERTDRPGIYAFDLRTQAGTLSRRFIAVNPDPRESDLTRATADELRKTANGVPQRYVRDWGTFTDQDQAPRSELWWPILLTTLVLLMLEQGLARWFGMRG